MAQKIRRYLRWPRRLLTAEPVTLRGLPMVRDIVTMAKLLAFMSANVSTVEFPATDYTVQAASLNDAVAPYELVKTMRASILTLGPAIARSGVAHVSLPGGCAIGARPVDLHLAALKKMGAEYHHEHGYIQAKVPNGGRLHGAHIVFEKITVTGTENILMAAALADGETVLENAAREPEITDLIHLLRKMGADIQGEETSTLRIRGVDKASRRRAHRDSRSYRGWHVPDCRGHHPWRPHHHSLRASAPWRAHAGKLEKAACRLKSLDRPRCAFAARKNSLRPT